MTVSHLVYDLATGLILKHAVGPRLRLRPGQAAILANWPGPDHYVHGGQILPLPPCPGSWAVFDPAAGEWIDPRSPAQATADAAHVLALARSAATARINAGADRVRALFVTDLRGQEMIYLRKEAEAIAYVAHPDPPEDADGFPFIAAEVGITAATPWGVAQVYLNMSGLWQAVGSALEALRLGAIADIEALTDAAAIDARLADFDASIANFRSAWGLPA
jgi:hypothetical protein